MSQNTEQSLPFDPVLAATSCNSSPAHETDKANKKAKQNEKDTPVNKPHFNVSQLLRFQQWRKVPVILQSEAAECGLASIAMLANYYGHKTDLISLRQRFGMSLKGANLAQLINIGNSLNFSCRALRLELVDVKKLNLPCVLHWDLNHFVVLKKVGKHKVSIIDPAVGERVLSIDEVSKHFTGVALELSPNKAFKKQTNITSMHLSDFYQKSSGLFSSLTKVFILSLLLQLFALAGPYYMQLVVDEVLLSNDQSLLVVLAFGFGLLALIELATKALRSTVVLHFSNVLNIQMAANLFSHLLRLPLDYFEKRHIGDVLSRFSSLGQVKEILTTGIIEAIIDGIMAIATLVMIAIYSIKLALVVVAALLAYAIVRFLLYKPIKQLSEEAIIAKANEQSNFMESIRAIQTIKLFGRENQRQNLWHNAYAEQLNCGIRLGKYEIHFTWINDVIFGLENVLVVFIAATLIIQGQLSVGMLFAFMSYKRQFVSKMVNVIEKVIEFKMLSLHLNRIADIALCQQENLNQGSVNQTDVSQTDVSQTDISQTDVKPATTEQIFTEQSGGGDQLNNLSGNSRILNQDNSVQSVNSDVASHQRPILTLNKISFAYHESEKPLFQDLSLSIKQGESIAIIGPSGCGKTTLMKLMLGLFSTTSGSIYLKGTNINHVGVQAYRQQVAAVMQDDQLLSGSIIDNISLFDQHVDFERLHKATTMAAIDSEINTMPMRYHSLIGDMGSSLSGGQKQRLLLARALYKTPTILFLDEATSHLDTRLESNVNNSIKSLNITRVIIAHRMETILSADSIYQLQQGKLIDVTDLIKQQS